ncbi:MAG: hypothetical protein FGM14_09105 [Flavobacteriales bacterium]|nr:hypothetical protein [Flavobacteriales bacterium]
MENNISKTDYDSFQTEWENQFNDIQHIIEFMHSNPLILEKLGLNNLISSSDLIKNQKEWIRLLSKYNGLEKEFFKPFWVPILNNDLCSFFIDLSDFNYPIFDVEYLNAEPEKYAKTSLVKSMQELLTFKDNEFKLDDIYSNYLERREELIWDHNLPKPKCSNVIVDPYIVIIEIELLGFIFESTLEEINLNLYIDYVFFIRQNYNLDKMYELENMILLEEYSIDENGKFYQNIYSHGGKSNGFVTVDYITLKSGFCLKTYLEERSEWKNSEE